MPYDTPPCMRMHFLFFAEGDDIKFLLSLQTIKPLSKATLIWLSEFQQFLLTSLLCYLVHRAM